MEALRQAYHFLRRHRRAIGFIAGASAAGLAIWRVKRVLDEYKRLIKEHDVARIDHHRLQMHMLRSRGECVPALLNFMQTLRKRVNEMVDVSSPVKALKSRRQQLSREEEAALWHQVKVSGFTRFFLAFYGFNLLNVLLRVQVHILGRYAYESSKREMEALLRLSAAASQQAQQPQQPQQSQGSSTTAATAGGKQLGDDGLGEAGAGGGGFGQDDRYKLLSLVYEYFLGTGLRRLKEAVEAVVSEELGAWSVHDKVHVSYAELHDALLRVRRRLEGPRGVTTGELPLLHFIVDLEAKEEEEGGGMGMGMGPMAGVESGTILYEMVNETWDALESASFKLAVEDCLDASFRVFLEDLYAALYAANANANANALALSALAAPAAHASYASSSPRKRHTAEDEEEEGGEETRSPQETGQDSRPEDREVAPEPNATSSSSSVAVAAPQASAACADPPLAKLIPHMKNAAAKIFHNDPQANDYIRVTADNRAVNLLCSSFFVSDHLQFPA